MLSAAALLALAAVLPAAPARADTWTMEPNSVSDSVDGYDGAQFSSPADGALHGCEFALTVVKAGPVQRVQTSETGWDTADRGQKLFGFVLRYDQDEVGLDVDVTGAVLADGGRIDIPSYRLSGLKGEHRFVASVPAGAKELVLQITSAGHTESFSLTQLAHAGPKPTVLYRDPLSAQVSRDDVGEDSVRVTDGASGDRGSLSFSLRRARLAFCTPPPGVRAADDPDKAFLVATFETESASSGAQFQHYKALPASALTATLADGTVVQAQHSGPDDEGFTSGSYWFPVPGGTEAARITVTPGTFDAYRYGMNAGEPSPVKADGSAVFDVEFTPGAASKLPKLAKGQKAATTTTAVDGPVAAVDDPLATVNVPRRTDKGSGGSPLLGLLVLALLGGSGWLAFKRRLWGRLRRPSVGDVPPPSPPPAVVDAPAAAVISTSTLEVTAATAVVAEPLADVMAEAASRPGSRMVVLGPETRAAVSGVDGLDIVRVAADESSLAAEVEAAALGAAREAQGETPPEGRPLVVVVTPPSMGPSVSSRLAVSLNGAGDSIDLRVVEAPPAPVTAPRAGAPIEDALAGEGPPIELRLLGPYRVIVRGREVASGFRGKARELLAFLAVNRDGLSMEAIVDALWGDLPSKRAEEQFSTNVSNARSVLRTAAGLSNDAMPIEKIGTRYRLDPSLVAVDAWGIDDADPLDVPLGGLFSDEDFTWAEPASERLRKTLLSRLRAAADAAVAAGAPERAVDVHDRIIEVDPYAEASYRELIRLQRQLGRSGDAQRTEQALAARRKELGLSPD